MTDNVNHPKHYESKRTVIEPIDLCEMYSFCIGNAIKYILRAGEKEGSPYDEDLRKARWYLNRVLEKNRECVTIEVPNTRLGLEEIYTTVYAMCSKDFLLRYLFRAGDGVLADDSPHLHCRITRFGVERCIEQIDCFLNATDIKEIK